MRAIVEGEFTPLLISQHYQKDKTSREDLGELRRKSHRWYRDRIDDRV